MVDLIVFGVSYLLLVYLGFEFLFGDFIFEVLVCVFVGCCMFVKVVLLDQCIVVGLGNIYVLEVLYCVGIDLCCLIGQIVVVELLLLVGYICDVLIEVIVVGGFLLCDYWQVSGELGYFQYVFWVYGCEGVFCFMFGCFGQICCIVQLGWLSFFCEFCQS